MDFKELQFAIFDCDGVIVDSNGFKVDAFRHAVSSFDVHLVEKLVTYNKLNGGISRYKKFEYFFREVICQSEESVANSVKQASNAFADFCAKGYSTLPLTKGVKAVLAQLEQHNVPCFIVSGGDRQEIANLLQNHDCRANFSEIHGNEKSKQDAVQMLFEEHTLKGKKGIYFGDAPLDAKVAEAFDIDFVFVSGYSDVTERDLGGFAVSNTIGSFEELMDDRR